MSVCGATICHLRVSVLENVPIARDTFRIRLLAPTLACRARPGQFFMLRLVQTTDPLLGRPFALYDTVLNPAGVPEAIDIVYLVVGKQTSKLALLRAGDELDVWGPLGIGFPTLSGLKHVALIAGGIGQTPFLAYIRELSGTRGYAGRAPSQGVDRVSFYYGVRSAAYAAGVDDFRAAGADVHLASDDGTLGTRGFVTQLVEQHTPPEQMIACGPTAMMKAVATLAHRWQVPCQLSLETPMACGIGICFSCVTQVQTPTGVDYKRVCVDGPVFSANELLL